MGLAVELAPRHPRYRATFGEALLAAGDDDAAARHLGVAVTLGAGPRVETFWAWAQLRTGAVDAAFATVEDALRRHGPFAFGLYVRALCCAVRGEAAETRAAFRAAAVEADDPDFYAAEAARVAEAGAGAAWGLARPLPANVLRRHFRGLDELRRGGGGEVAC